MNIIDELKKKIKEASEIFDFDSENYIECLEHNIKKIDYLIEDCKYKEYKIILGHDFTKNTRFTIHVELKETCPTEIYDIVFCKKGSIQISKKILVAWIFPK